MAKSKMILVTGLPATGKTTLSQLLSEELKVPLLAKDTLKELLFDNLGWVDKAWSQKLANAAFHIMDYIIEQQLRVGHALIVEANFLPHMSSDRFARWQQRFQCDVVQIVCRSDLEVLAQRFYDRARADRHPGHLDTTGTVAAHREALSARIADGQAEPLRVKSRIFTIDTTDFTKLDLERVLDDLRVWLAT